MTGCSSTTTTSSTGTVSTTTTCSPAASYAFNPSPDIVAKLAFEPGFGHYEIFGVYSRFRDRIFPCEDVSSTSLCGGSTKPGPNAAGAFNSAKNGGGFGANARWSFANKHVDFGLHGFGGSGVGRYGTAGLPDVSVHADGTLYLVKSLQGLSTLEFHTRKADIYFNGGAEYAGRAADYDPITKKYVGYGSPHFNNTGCLNETGPGAGGFLPGGLSNCTADTRVVTEATAGVWFKVLDGAKEKLNWGRIPVWPAILGRDSQRLVRRGFPERGAGNRQYGFYLVPLLPAIKTGWNLKRYRIHTPALGQRKHCPDAGFSFAEKVKVRSWFLPGGLAPAFAGGMLYTNDPVVTRTNAKRFPWLVSRSTIPSTT